MKKALSLSLAAIMLLTMIPMGAIGIFAEENVIEIGSVDEWNAAAGSDLAGKTIKLTADFGGTEGNLAELTPLTTSAFTGNFDGAGHTISYVTSTAALVGMEIPNSTTVEIKDVTIAHSTVNSSRNYAVNTMMMTVLMIKSFLHIHFGIWNRNISQTVCRLRFRRLMMANYLEMN